MPNLTLAGIRRSSSYENSEFQKLYEKLISNSAKQLTEAQRIKLLRFGIYFFNCAEDGVKRLGYRIIVRYANVFEDYVPLYDISLNAGFIPVAKFIEKKHLEKKRVDQQFFNSFLSAYKENFKDGKKYLSEGQKDLYTFNTTPSDSLIVAPTSYGKSEMMINRVQANLGKKVCIIVPSKALLAQTKRRLLRNTKIASRAKRIVTHPEMYRDGDEEFVAVLTQERLLRLLQKNPHLGLDLLLLDEAHNLLDGGDRGSLLIQTILIAKRRNSDIELGFFTPFLAKAESVESPYADYKVSARYVREFIKIERFYLYEQKNNEFTLYDQFVDRHIKLEVKPQSELDFVTSHLASKNIIYLNKPRQVEEVAAKLCVHPSFSASSIILTHEDKEFQQACAAIADFLHPEYKVLQCLKNGVLYHHGRIPEIIRLYVEDIYTKYHQVPVIVTTSTLLEGVNIPAEKIFLMSTKRGQKMLSRASFKNLCGRVCRFSEIFSDDDGNLELLEPEIYILNGDYAARNFNPVSFLKDKASFRPDDQLEDDVENPLLSNFDDADEDRVRSAIEYIENIENGTVNLEEHDYEIRYVESDVAKACFANNVNEFDIHLHEKTLKRNQHYIELMSEIGDESTILEGINRLFLTDIALKDSELELARLRHAPTRKFYAMFLGWRKKGATYKEMINSFLRHWEERIANANRYEDNLIYVGNAWGEVKLHPEEHVERYVDISKQSRAQRINLAIVRIKEEQDFVDFKLMKFIDVLNDLEYVESKFYDQLKYGSSNKKVICLMKNGISLELAKILVSGKYDSYLDLDLDSDTVRIKSGAKSAFVREQENPIMIFELQFHAERKRGLQLKI